MKKLLLGFILIFLTSNSFAFKAKLKDGIIDINPTLKAGSITLKNMLSSAHFQTETPISLIEYTKQDVTNLTAALLHPASLNRKTYPELLALLNLYDFLNIRSTTQLSQTLILQALATKHIALIRAKAHDELRAEPDAFDNLPDELQRQYSKHALHVLDVQAADSYRKSKPGPMFNIIE